MKRSEAVSSLSASYFLLKTTSFVFVRPHHSMQVVFNVWSLDMLGMQILRPNPRTYGVTSSGAGLGIL